MGGEPGTHARRPAIGIALLHFAALPTEHQQTASAAPGTASPRSVSFISLGCPKNLVDSEKMLGLLARDGIAPVPYDPENPGSFGDADAVVINTCGFLEASKDESLSVIKEAIAAKDRGEIKRVVVAGCLVQRHRAKMLEWAPGIDAMVGVFDRDRIVEAVRGGSAETAEKSGPDAAATPPYWIAASALQAAKARGMSTTGLTVNGKDGKGIGYFEDDSQRVRITPRHLAYLRISEGCNQNCAFCTIPSIRGKMRSKPIERITAEARELLLDGAFELNLIGQDTTSYGYDLGIEGGMPEMLRSVCEAVRSTSGKNGGWVRLMYAYPSNFSDEMIEAFAALAAEGPLVPYIDIPLQHASNNMLTAMRRNVSAEQQRELILKLRERIPGMAVRTTFISGFPGETEEDHEELLAFVDEMAFEAVGVFEYSREPGTVAGRMEEDPALAVPAEVKARRRGEIMALQQKIAFEQAAFLAEQFDEKSPAPQTTGVQFDVLIDAPLASRGLATSGVGRGGRLYKARAYFQAPGIDSVTFVQSGEKLAAGELVRCTVVGSDGYDLVARPTAELDKRVGLTILK
jgi:ribosomal protein S12 methylthiotransferase